VFDETGKGIAESTETGPDGSYTLDDCPSCQGQVVAADIGYYSARGSGPDYTLFEAPKSYVGLASSTTLTFAWNSTPGAVAYRITFAADRTFAHPTIISRTTKTRHTFTQLVKNHIYYVIVNPIDAGSNVHKADIWLGDPLGTVAGRPGYVNNLHATNRTSTSVTLAWAPLLFASGTEYQVQLSRTSSFSSYRTKWSLHGNTTLSFSNLSPGTTYYARVRARNVSHTYTTPWSGIKTTGTL
jgi:hypothetical protein